MIDEIIEGATSQVKYNKEAFKQRKKLQKEKAYEMIDKSLDELKTNSDFFKTYLDVQSNFDMYTPRNALLIAKQMPNAKQLKSKIDWKNLKITFRTPKPKEIIIIEPGEAYKNRNGEIITPIYSKEVIDISETNSKPNVKNYDKKLILQSLVHDSIIPIRAVDNLASDKICEWNQEEKVIYICRNDDYDLTIKSLVNELAKISLYESCNEIDNDKADCISYMVCKKFGIDTAVKGIDNLCTKYSNMEKIDIANDLTSMKEIVLDINEKMKLYLEEKKKDNQYRESKEAKYER